MRAKIISSLEKCFLDETVSMKKTLGNISMLKNERYSFQVCYDEEVKRKYYVFFSFALFSRTTFLCKSHRIFSNVIIGSSFVKNLV